MRWVAPYRKRAATHRPMSESPPRSRLASPSPVLHPWTRGYVQQGMDVPPPLRLRLKQSAHTEPVLCVTWSGTVLAEGYGPDPLPRFAFAPIFARALMHTYEGHPRGFFVRLHPVAPLALFGLNASHFAQAEVFDPFATGHGRYGGALHRWADEVCEASGFEERVALTDETFKSFQPLETARVCLLREAVGRIEAARGVIHLPDLARSLETTARRLHQHFEEGLGLSLERFADVTRFRRAHAFAHATPDASWAETAQRFGYADHAELVQAYHQFAGVSPADWTPEWRFIDLNFGIEESELGPAQRRA